MAKWCQYCFVRYEMPRGLVGLAGLSGRAAWQAYLGGQAGGLVWQGGAGGTATPGPGCLAPVAWLWWLLTARSPEDRSQKARDVRNE